MSAVLKPQRSLRAMLPTDLPRVLEIEQAAYEFPWSRGNFVDSLHAGYFAQVLFDEQSAMLAYLIAMQGVDEMHLLNLSVAPPNQGRGHARWMLDSLLAHCRGERAAMLWLEVRKGNQRARSLYRRYGFDEIGVRRSYYPAAAGVREDAIVMSIITSTPESPDNKVVNGLD